ncbi:MAG TPA: hypothetical protein EYQ50_17060 [Verrucomicrobiales bacterium]|nr:hypothetical protein [Verrucomicrobiales bacterium]
MICNQIIICVLAMWFCGCGQEKNTASESVDRAADSDLTEYGESLRRKKPLLFLPQNFREILEHFGNLEFNSASMFSRSLGHYRRVRFPKGSNVVFSETGRQAGKVDVVEVILISVDPNRESEFALYSPETGERLDRYPESVAFDIEGIHGGSQNPVPMVCNACHLRQRPLNAILPWTSRLEESIADARRRGIGIRQLPVDPKPDDESMLNSIRQINTQMQEQFPEFYYDLRILCFSLSQ